MQLPDSLFLIVPYTGLSLSELAHLRRDWISYRSDDTSDKITSPTVDDPDWLLIRVPDQSPCVGSTRYSPEGKGRLIEKREEPCSKCKPDGIWEPYGESQIRTVPVHEETAVETIRWWLTQYDSFPFTPSSDVSRWLDELAEEAGVSRNFGIRSFRRTYGVLLASKGFESETIAEVLGMGHRYKTRELYEVAGESVDWDDGSIPPSVTREEMVEELQRLAEELGRRPYLSDIREHSKYSLHPFRETFGGIRNALEEAGFERPENRIRTEDLGDSQQPQIWMNTGNTPEEPTTADMRNGKKQRRLLAFWTRTRD